jgi:hypothetical protein
VRCPHCDNRLLQKSGSSTKVRITGCLEIDEDGMAKAQCYWCKGAVTLPISFKATTTESERFTIPIRRPS